MLLGVGGIPTADSSAVLMQKKAIVKKTAPREPYPVDPRDTDFEAAMRDSIDSLAPHQMGLVEFDPSSRSTTFFDHCTWAPSEDPIDVPGNLPPGTASSAAASASSSGQSLSSVQMQGGSSSTSPGVAGSEQPSTASTSGNDNAASGTSASTSAGTNVDQMGAVGSGSGGGAPWVDMFGVCWRCVPGNPCVHHGGSRAAPPFMRKRMRSKGPDVGGQCKTPSDLSGGSGVGQNNPLIQARAKARALSGSPVAGRSSARKQLKKCSACGGILGGIKSG